ADRGEFVRVLEVSRDAWTPWMPSRPSDPSGADAFELELTRARTGREAGTHLRLAAFLEDHRLAGLFSLNEIVRGPFQSGYAGWSVSADQVGRGLGTEGVRALLDIAFTDAPVGLGLHRVQANIIPENGASLRIAEKVGLRREGLALRYLRIAGAWEDHLMFALTREEHEASPRPASNGSPASERYRVRPDSGTF
ncbi:MAG TPA: GNAT family protein, partial [Longimicrobiales bacterium]|nr:GNAT family protein [Longimicrobiales bacterium]